jgi:hypothetical protein
MMIVVAIIAVVVLLLIYFTIQGNHVPLDAPPGPFRLPILGNALSFGADPVKSFTKIGKDYPKGLYSLEVGNTFMVVLHKFSIGEYVLKTKGM